MSESGPRRAKWAAGDPGGRSAKECARRHDGIDVLTHLRVAQHFDGIARRLQGIFRTPDGHPLSVISPALPRAANALARVRGR